MFFIHEQQRTGKGELAFWGIALLAMSILVSFPFFSAHHVLLGQDLAFHLGRIEGIAEGLRGGQLPVRINPVQLGGYGMPTEIFYPNLFLYLPALLRLAGVPLIASWDVLNIFLNLVTAFAGWWGFSVLFRSSRTGAVASLCYLVGLYRLIMMYDGAGLGVLQGMAFLPAALAAIWATLQREAACWPAAVFFTVCIFLSHILSSLFLVLAAGIMLVLSLPRFLRADVRHAVGKSCGFVALLTIWFYAPFLYFQHTMDYVIKQWTHREVVYESIHPPASLDWFLGSAFLLLLICLALWMIFHLRRAQAHSFFFFLAAAVGIVALVSHPAPWHVLGTAVGVIQFPARLLVFAQMAASMAAALGLAAVGLGTAKRRVGVVLCVFTIFGANCLYLSGYRYAVPLQPREQDVLPAMARVGIDRALPQMDFAYGGYKDYMDTETLKKMTGGASSASLVDAALQEKFRDTGIHPDDRIEKIDRIGNDFRLQAAAGAPAAIQLPVFWYDGYRADSPAGSVTAFRDDDGQVSIRLPAEACSVHVWYAGLPWFFWTDMISLFSLPFFVYVSQHFLKPAS